MNKKEAIKLMNEYGAESKAFLFLIDFDMNKPIICSLDRAEESGLKYSIDEEQKKKALSKKIKLEKFPLTFEEYRKAFDTVFKEIYDGNTYLLNLTFPTRIETDLSLEQIYELSSARYKILLKDRFVCFSPETFVKIIDGKIYSYPMKGTIDASIPGAAELILSDEKETAEHNTIVDLIRNDLSIVARNVRVNKFRYIDRLETHDKSLLQVSSEIVGDLPPDYKHRLGDIIFSLLPAGSITGAPKKKTVEIIKRAENYERGYYTGIFGVFNGESLNSCVLIRFIESIDGTLYYKSGGGITHMSNPEFEYEELLKKIYVPIN
ncbi:aminodeoxychorismate synthase component I [Melioribacter sp. OK-6-Me]|uniref:aminodeoxychorismate synthase component I n=1 Tax=unclassified Melioribacter TaxID=2627329 RepID=UPI003ED99775